MIYRKSTLLIFSCLFLPSAACCAGEKAAVSPEALISRARIQEELRTEGTPPMVMRAELQVSNGKDGLMHGDYTLDWGSPSQWREEIRFGDYVRLRVGDAKGYWQTSGLSYQPEVVFQLDTLLYLRDVIRVRANQTLGRVRNRKNAGVLQNCTDVKSKSGTATLAVGSQDQWPRTLCFDEANGALVSVEYATGENQTPPEISRIEYSAFHAVAGKLVPCEIRALKDRKVVAIVTVVEIEKITQQNPALFTAPVNAEFWGQCDDMQQAEPVDLVLPRYPETARANHEQGRVIFYAVIEADGSLSHIATIQGAAPDLEAAALGAIRQWHYHPAACGQIRTRVEVSIPMDFRIGQ